MPQRKKTDRAFISAKEHLNLYGGKLAGDPKKKNFAPLAFDHCALSFQPFETPYATADGTIFELENILPFLKKYKKHPITGKKLSFKDLIKANFSKNTEDKYICPLTYKPFTPHSHIVMIRTTGNVYSMEAIKELNIKAKNWTDLQDGTPFKRSDIITIQDPNNMEKRNIKSFFHVKAELESPGNKKDARLKNINVNSTASKIFDEIREREAEEEERRKKRMEEESKRPRSKAEELAASKGSSSKTKKVTASAGFTCAGFYNEVMDNAEKQSVKVTKKKGYVAMHTNMGDINLQLHCDLIPVACENFLRLCEKGYYDNVRFHRLIKNFMIQGGDPSGTGHGGESHWGRKFEDEFHPTLSHNKRGVLSMANAGRNTNGSQFFITFSPCTHLNNRHSVFGQVVGGISVLDDMEKVPTSSNDKPMREIKILRTTVYANPFDHLEEEKKEEEEEAKMAAKNQREKNEKGAWFSNPNPNRPDVKHSGVGKYMENGGGVKRAKVDFGAVRNSAKKSRRTGKFDFASWG